jgi:hypothetical protein
VLARWHVEKACYRPRYLNIQRLNYLWTIRLSSARIAGNLIAEPPYLYRPTLQVVQRWLIRRGLPWFGRALICSLPPVAAVCCERAGGSRTGREPGRRSRRLEGVLDAAARERIIARRAGQGGPGLGVFAGGVRAFLLWGDQPAAAEDGRKGAASLTWVRGAQVGAPATR